MSIESRAYWRKKSDARVREFYERAFCELEDELGVKGVEGEWARGRIEVLERDLAAAQDKLATRAHRPGALVEAVDAEARLAKLQADKQADEEALVSRVQELEEALQNERIDHNNTTVRLRQAQADIDRLKAALNNMRSAGPAPTTGSMRPSAFDSIQGSSIFVPGALIELERSEAERRAKDVVSEIAAERHRQKTECGWTESNDDGHTNEDLAWAATHYAAPTGAFDQDGNPAWPFGSEPKFFSHLERRRELVIAAALIVAEVERLDRAAKKAPLSAPVIIPGIPCQPPEEVARGVLDLERAEARDATGRAP